MNKLLIGLLALGSFSILAEVISVDTIKSSSNVGSITVETEVDDKGRTCEAKLAEMKKRLKKSGKKLLTDNTYCDYKGHPGGGVAIYSRTILFL